MGIKVAHTWPTKIRYYLFSSNESAAAFETMFSAQNSHKKIPIVSFT